MMRFRPVLLLFSFFSLVYMMPEQPLHLTSLIRGELVNFYATAFDVPESAISLDYRHVPEIVLPEEDYSLTVESQHQPIKLGYQTVWISVRRGEQVLDRIQLVLDAAVTIPVVQTKVRLTRGQKIQKDDLDLVETTLHENLDQYYRSPYDLAGKVARQMIPKNRQLQRSMVKVYPDALKGDKVNIQLVTAGLTITTAGVLRHEAVVGEDIDVTCVKTGKRLTGILTSPEDVLVKMR